MVQTAYLIQTLAYNVPRQYKSGNVCTKGRVKLVLKLQVEVPVLNQSVFTGCWLAKIELSLKFDHSEVFYDCVLFFD